MPTYGPLDCTVSLLLWEPLKGKTIINKAGKGTSMENPWDGQHVEKIKEDYFNSPGGVDFIGPSNSPFYFINAGQDLFFSSPTKINKGKGKEQEQNEDTDVEDGILPPTPTPLPRQLASSKEDDDDSALSNIPSSNFDASSPVFGRSINLDGPSDELNTTLKKSPPKGWNARNPIVPISAKSDIPKPISDPLPIKIQVDFSRTTFMPSLVTGKLSDICITIYYNGQLTHCRIIKSTTVRSSTADGKQPAFSGRRVGNELEAPFVLTPIPAADLGSSKKTLSFGERWVKVNQSLLNEADEWGREGKYATFRTPFGEYLEELSKLEVPECLKGRGRNGAHAGIIDVVVALGHSLIINNDVSALTKPERKLPEGICGKANTKYIVPEERLMRKDFTLLGDLMGEEIKRVGNTKIKGRGGGHIKEKSGKPSSMPPPDLLFKNHAIHSGNVNEVEGAIQDIMQALGRNICASEAVHELVPLVEQKFSDISSRQGEPSSSQPLASMMQESANSGKVPMSHAKSLAMANRNDTEQLVTEPKLHPNMPKKVPQKRWKGSVSKNRPKYEGRWDIEPFDINKPTSLSTRSHRNAAPPDPASATQVQIPPDGDLRPRVPGPKFEYSQYLSSKDGENIHMGDQEDHMVLPPSPSPMARNDRFTASRPERNGLRLYNTPQEHAREAYSSSHRDFLQSEGKSVYPGFGIDGTEDVGSSRTTRSGTSFASPDTKDTPSRTTRAGTSFATPDTINNLKRKHSSTIVSPVISSDGPPKKIPRLEAGSETQDLADQKAQPFNGFDKSDFLINHSEHIQNYSSLPKSSAFNSTTKAISSCDPEKKKRHRAAVSHRELKAVLGSHNPSVPVNKSLTASFSEMASSGSRSRSQGDEKIHAQLRATAKAGKLGISVMHETLHLTVFSGSKVRELLMKIQSKSSVERDSRQTMEEIENDLRHRKTSQLSRRASMTSISDELTISRVSEVPAPAASKILLSSTASVGSAHKQSKTQAPPRKQLPSGKNVGSSKPGSHETLVPPPSKLLRSRKKAESLASVGGPIQNKLHPKPKSAADGVSSTTQNNQEKSSVKPNLRSSTQTPGGMTLPTVLNAPQTFKSPAITDNTKSFNTQKYDAVQLPVAGKALPSTPDSDIPLSKLVKRKQTSLAAKPLATTRNPSIPPSILSKKRKSTSPTLDSVPILKVKYSKPNLITPQVATSNDKTPGTQRSRGSGSSTLSPDPDWEPIDLCETSVLTYANLQNTSGWAGLEFDAQSGKVFRSSRREMQGVFRASSIVMGVRYVVGVRSE